MHSISQVVNSCSSRAITKTTTGCSTQRASLISTRAVLKLNLCWKRSRSIKGCVILHPCVHLAQEAVLLLQARPVHSSSGEQQVSQYLDFMIDYDCWMLWQTSRACACILKLEAVPAQEFQLQFLGADPMPSSPPTTVCQYQFSKRSFVATDMALQQRDTRAACQALLLQLLAGGPPWGLAAVASLLAHCQCLFSGLHWQCNYMPEVWFRG